MGTIKFTNKENFVRKPNVKYQIPESTRFFQLSQGNSKLLDNDFFAFRVWNILPVITCPYATALCKKYCYANKSTRLFKNTRLLQENNYNESMKEDFTSNMISAIKKEIAKEVKKERKILFRIHESGDFYNYSYFQSWVQIANYFKGNENIIFQAYTKSVPFIDKHLKENNTTLENINIHFVSSIWQDTKQEMIELTKKLKLQTFTAKKENEIQEMENKPFICNCQDCGKCRQCYQSKVNEIIVPLH